MTSLALQLKRLALPQTDPNLWSRKDVASLLFEPKDAATMDRATFYALGCTGLEELMGIEPSLCEFQQTLFSSSSVTLERSVQSKDANVHLDRDIALFLCRLSPYFLLRPAHKCLEWLIHRFHIHLYNVDRLVACVLPFHDSKVFVRVVQLLKIHEPTSKWNWLQCLQKPGVPLSRLTLVTHCCKDLGFMDFICNMVSDAIQAFSGGGSQLRVVFSFFASTIISALDSAEIITDAMITKLLPHVQKGLRSVLVDFRASALMVVCELSVKVTMQKVLLQSLSGIICKSLKDGVLVRESLAALTVLLQNQTHAGPTRKALSRLVLVPGLASSLESMAQTHDVTPLLRHLLPHLMHCTFSSDSAEASSCAELLEELLSQLPLTSDLDLCRLLLDLYLAQSGISHELLEELNQRLLPVLRVLETKCNSSLDRTLSSCVSGLTDEKKPLFHQLLSLSATSGKFQVVGDSDSCLVLSLNHPHATVRIMGLEKLRELLRSGQDTSLEQSFIKASVFERLHDDDFSVVSAALELLQMILDSLDPEEIVSSLLSLLHRAEDCYSQDWCPVLSEAVRLMGVAAAGQSDADGLLFRLLPLLVPSGAADSVRYRLSLSLSQSPVARQHPLTTGWSSDLQEALQSSPNAGPEQVLVLVQTLISTLSRNIQNMETFSRRHTLDSLCSCVEDLSGSGSGSGSDRTSLLVLVQTLVLGLRHLSDTHHLLTARRVYRAIERHLLESTQDPGPAPCPAPSCDWLVLYLQSDGQLDWRLVLVSVLSNFITELKSPDEAFKGDEWWNPERLDTNTCCYLHLLTQVFCLLMGGASHGPITVQYRQLLKHFLQTHLQNSLVLFRFLSHVWSYSGLYGDQEEGRGQARSRMVLQMQALLMGAALLENQRPDQLQEILEKTPVFPTLLVVLSSLHHELRRAGLVVLRSLSLTGSWVFGPIAERLLRTADEVVADGGHLSRTLEALFHHDTQEVSAAYRKLLQSVQSPRCPSSTACALLGALGLIHGQEVLSALVPALDRLLAQIGPDAPSLLPDETRLLALLLRKFSPEAAPLLVTDTHCRALFLRALKQNQNLQVCALEQISRSFFSALDDEAQQLLLSAVLDVLAMAPGPAVAQAVSRVFKQISLDARLVASELCPEKPSGAVSVQQTRRSKMLQSRKAAECCAAGPEGGGVHWHRVTLILELLQHKKKLTTPQALIPALFSLLQRRLEASQEDQASVEYTKQLLLSCLLSMCSKLSTSGAPIPPDVLDPERFSVELVVQCIRSSEMSQTHHQALLLLSAVAPIYPEKVLLNIMSIFTFMGANILRLDDAYSFRVIHKTVHMVLPAIIQAQDSSGPDSPHLQAVVTRVLQVFVDALPHVPDHRRVPVLVQVLTTVGPDRFLWVLLTLVFKKQTTAASPATGSTDRVLDHWDMLVSICCEFGVEVQIQSLVQVLLFLQQLPHDKGQARQKLCVRAMKLQEEKMEDLIFNLETQSSKELRHFKYLSLTFCSHLLQSSRFISQLLELEHSGAADEALQEQQQRLLEQILSFIHSVAQFMEQDQQQPKFWRILLSKSYELLNQVLVLLPSDSFITVTRGLMGNEVSNVRRKALELLNNKLQQKNIIWDPKQTSLLLSLLPELQSTSSSEKEAAVNRQTALFSLKLLCRLFGESQPESFVAVMSLAVSVVTATEEDRNVMATALQCVAECITALKALAVPHLPSLVPVLISSLSHRKDEIYLLSSVTALHRLMVTLHNFTSPYLPGITTQVCHLSRLAEVSSLSPLVSSRLAELKSTIATKVPPRVLLPTVSTCYEQLVQDQKIQLVALMSVLQEHVSHMDKDQLTLHQSELTSFFLTALDFRAAHCQDDLQVAQEVEGSVIDCLLCLVLKLSEVSFRPLFFKLLEWSKSAPCGSTERLLTFLRLCDSIALKLKGLFVLFAANLIKPFCQILTSEVHFQSEEKTSLLLKLVLDCLYKICLFDTNKFMNHDRAAALMGPMVNQLENLQGSEADFGLRVTQSLVPCLGQFAVALADDSQWKTLNYQILLKTRHQHHQVRLASLAALLELCCRLRENFLVLLPETVPFLAELMEDESEEVEKEVQRVVQEMENVLGEPLQSYF